MKIRKVEIIPLNLDFAFKRRTSLGALVYGQRGELTGQPVFVRIVDDEGREGYGQIRPHNPFQGETTESILGALRSFYGPRLIGRNPWEREAIVADLVRALPGNSEALQAIDVAIHDLLGRATGLSIAELLGGPCCERIPLEWSVGLGDAEQMLAEALRAVRTHGMKVVCLKVGPIERWELDIEVFRAVREAVGSEITLGIDGNGGYDVPTSIRVITKLEEYGLAYVEQPVPRFDVDGMREIRARISTPLMADDCAFGLHDSYRVIAERACDVMVIKLYKCGGFTIGKKVTALAEAASIGINLGGTAHGSQIEAAAAAHFWAATTSPRFGAEFAFGLNTVEQDPLVTEGCIVHSDGYALLPSGPGLGVTPNADAVASCALQRFVIE